MSYDLYFEDILIGTIKYGDSDFPNLFGDIAYSRDYLVSAVPKAKRVREYLDLQTQSMELVDVEHKQDVAEDLEKVNAMLDQYLDMIETDAWCLISDKKEKLPILSPIIRSDCEVTWRWSMV